MEPSEILRWLAKALERLQIPYLVTGSMATIAYGEPRFTNDIDVVVDLYREGGSEKHLRDIDGVLEVHASDRGPAVYHRVDQPPGTRRRLAGVASAN